MLEVGTKALNFSFIDNDSKDISLENLQGQWVVVYFYPKDDTPGCTKEACAFRDNISELNERKIAVLGISPDTVESHQQFTEKFELNFPLVPDGDKEICTAYGTYGEKKMYGKTFMGIKRTTFIIDPEGIIQHIFNNVRVPNHVEKVIAKIDELKSK